MNFCLKRFFTYYSYLEWPLVKVVSFNQNDLFSLNCAGNTCPCSTVPSRVNLEYKPNQTTKRKSYYYIVHPVKTLPYSKCIVFVLFDFDDFGRTKAKYTGWGSGIFTP